jgi:hypothetical protein
MFEKRSIYVEASTIGGTLMSGCAGAGHHTREDERFCVSTARLVGETKKAGCKSPKPIGDGPQNTVKVSGKGRHALLKLLETIET